MAMGGYEDIWGDKRRSWVAHARKERKQQRKVIVIVGRQSSLLIEQLICDAI